MTSLTPLALFKNLSEETRLTLVLLLRQAGELCVCELVSALEESQPKVSRHLAMLRESGLLIDRREDCPQPRGGEAARHHPRVTSFADILLPN